MRSDRAALSLAVGSRAWLQWPTVNSRCLRIALFGAAGVAAAGCHPSRQAQIGEIQATISHYCLDCHNYAEQVGNLTLEHASLDNVAADPEKWEHVVRKLRAGMMPPPGKLRPARDMVP